MQNEGIKNDPKDTQVVSFRNGTDFGFTPEMGCMFDGRAINGNQGGPGINAGESMILPYHVAHRLATNLAKIVKLRRAPAQDMSAVGLAVVAKPLWSDEDLEALKNSYLTQMYTEVKPVQQSQTELLMARVEEYRKMVEQLLPKPIEAPVTPVVAPVVDVVQPVNGVAEPAVVPTPVAVTPQVFADKQDVIAELEKRGIKHDKRQNKDNLIKLLG